MEHLQLEQVQWVSPKDMSPTTFSELLCGNACLSLWCAEPALHNYRIDWGFLIRPFLIPPYPRTKAHKLSRFPIFICILIPAYIRCQITVRIRSKTCDLPHLSAFFFTFEYFLEYHTAHCQITRYVYWRANWERDAMNETRRLPTWHLQPTKIDIKPITKNCEKGTWIVTGLNVTVLPTEMKMLFFR